MGQLITNMSHSLTGQRKGPVSVAETRGEMVIRVLAADHFRPGVTTLYGFRIDERFWLPVAVEEATPAGRVKRVVTFRDLLINTGITQAFFGKSGG